MYASWDIECDRHNFLSFWTIFCPFTLLLTPKIKICNKFKRKTRDVILLHLCTINEDHMMYGSWDVRHDKQSFLSFWVIWSLTFLTTWNIKILKKWKNACEYYHFTLAYYDWWSYDVWFMRYGAWQRIFSHFGTFFTLYTEAIT